MELRFTDWTVIIHRRYITRYTVTIITAPLAHCVNFKLLFPILYSCESQVTFLYMLTYGLLLKLRAADELTITWGSSKCEIKRFRRIPPTTITGPKNWSYFISHEGSLFVFAYSATNYLKKYAHQLRKESARRNRWNSLSMYSILALPVVPELSFGL